ncbi:MAG TPA: protoporphyrinogen oxidase [Burkholderiales bacterium]
MTIESEILIVGAGISGLTAAWRLQSAGRDVQVIEANPRAGGAIGSIRVEGCLIESGPNSTLETSPLIGQLIAETGSDAGRIYANASARNRFVLRGGRLIPVPMSPPAFIRTPLFSLGTKLGLLREPFVGRAPADAEETVAQFVRRRLGAEFLDYAINPFVAGVYAGDPERLSVQAAFPRLAALEQKYGSLIRGQILGARERKRNPEKSKQAAPMLSFRDGMQTLTDGIAGKIRRLTLSTRATGLERDGSRWVVSTDGSQGRSVYRAPLLLLAMPAEPAARLLRNLAPLAAAALEAIPYPPVAAVVSAYSRADIVHALDGFGFLVPEKERRRLLGTIFSSALFENRAPEDIALLTTFVGGMRQPELARQDEDRIAAMVHDELAQLIGARAKPRWTRVTRWARAIPQYTLGHGQRMAVLDAAERDLPGLNFCANFRGGISVADCIKSAHAVAERIIAPAHAGVAVK